MCPQRALQGNYWLDRQMVSWHQTPTGTMQNNKFTFNVRVCQKSFNSIKKVSSISQNNSHFTHTPMKFGATKHYFITPSTYAVSMPMQKHLFNKYVEKFLDASWTAHCFSATGSQSAKPTTNTLCQTQQLLDYFALQEDAVLTAPLY